MEWFLETVSALGNSPFLQGTLAFFGTFVLEDPTVVACGFLVAVGKMSYTAALIGLTLGTSVGDFLLYLLGRFGRGKVLAWGLVKKKRLAAAESWFHDNAVSAIAVSRFLPGMRLPTYLAAGVLRIPATRFLAVVIPVTVLWDFCLLNISVFLGRKAFEMAGQYAWPFAAALIVIVVCVDVFIIRRRKKKAETENGGRPVVSFFEFWPGWLFYAPIVPYYAWLSLRHWGPLLPSAANPKVYASGLINESKSEILDLVSPEERESVAPWTIVTNPNGHAPAKTGCLLAEKAMRDAGLSFPVVAKPDVGQRGSGVRPVYNSEDLCAYVRDFPPAKDMMLQELVPYEGEAGIFYYRMPGEDDGKIFSITLKYMPKVTGDGKRSLKELILADERARRIKSVYFDRFQERLGDIVPEGDVIPLVFAGNHCKGAVFENGNALITPELTKRMNALAKSIPEFYFGRFDVRFASLEALKKGRGFRIVEINGAGSEATHIWDARTTLGEAYRTLFRQFRILFEIGAANRRRGYRSIRPMQFLRDVYAYKRGSKKYPSTC